MQKANEQQNSEFRIRLQEEFARRMRANGRYSLRSFAQALGIHSSTLAHVLGGKRNLSEIKIKTLCKKLGLPVPQESSPVQTAYEAIQLDHFTAIADWYHFAILDLTLLKNFKSDIAWIARKLSIQPYEALGAVERLKRLGMLVEKKGKLQKAQGFYSNYVEGTTSAALKEYQRQIIKKALLAVDGIPQEAKDITSMTIAADSKKLKEAKEKIKQFRRELCAFLEDGSRDSVFHLALQLYPVTSLEN